MIRKAIYFERSGRLLTCQHMRLRKHQPRGSFSYLLFQLVVIRLLGLLGRWRCLESDLQNISSTILTDKGEDSLAVLTSEDGRFGKELAIPAFSCPSDLDFGHLVILSLFLVFGQSLGAVDRGGSKLLNAVAQVFDAESGAYEHDLVPGRVADGEDNGEILRHGVCDMRRE
jgi:hypothetical protein